PCKDVRKDQSMRVCLFEDRGVANLEPLTFVRPAFDLLCGQTSLAGKQCRHFAPCGVGFLLRPSLMYLSSLSYPTPPVNDLAWLRAEPTILVNSRWLPPAGGAANLSGPCLAMLGDEIAYAVVGPEHLTYCSATAVEDCLESWKN